VSDCGLTAAYRQRSLSFAETPPLQVFDTKFPPQLIHDDEVEPAGHSFLLFVSTLQQPFTQLLPLTCPQSDDAEPSALGVQHVQPARTEVAKNIVRTKKLKEMPIEANVFVFI
jgi:hypothetical protein